MALTRKQKESITREAISYLVDNEGEWPRDSEYTIVESGEIDTVQVRRYLSLRGARIAFIALRVSRAKNKQLAEEMIDYDFG